MRNPQIVQPPKSIVRRGHIYGLTLSNDPTDAVNDIGIAAGEVASSSATPSLITQASALIKKLDANWAAGTNQGMRNSAAAIADITYFIYAVSKAGGADADIYAHASAVPATALTALQAETGGSAYVNIACIGAIIRSGAAIVAFVQDGDTFILSTPSQNLVESANPGTAAVTRTLTVPIGVRVNAIIIAALATVNAGVGNTGFLLSDLSAADVVPTYRIASVAAETQSSLTTHDTGEVEVYTNTSGQIRSRLSTSTAAIFVSITTKGWIFPRARL